MVAIGDNPLTPGQRWTNEMRVRLGAIRLESEELREGPELGAPVGRLG